MSGKTESCKLGSTVHKCPSLRKLTMCLHFYNSMDDFMDDDDNLLIEYFNQYKQLLNDYSHILYIHLDSNKISKDIINKNYIIINKQINKYLQYNDILKSKHFKQNRRERTNKNNKIENKNQKLTFYIDILDTIIVSFVHSFDIGLRINSENTKTSQINIVDDIIKKQKMINNFHLKNSNNSYIINNKFEIGYRYSFWDWFKNNGDLDEYNGNNYKYSDWYIYKKYDNLKEELMNNKIYKIKLNEYNNCLYKATEYFENSDIIKSLKCDSNNLLNMHYDIIDINKDKTISLQHLIAILMFIDYKELSMNFCKYIVKINENEQDKILRQRVREYRNWYKLIRESVDLFGNKLADSKTNNWYSSISQIDGDQNKEVIFNKFAIRFNQPLFITNSIYSAIANSSNNNNNNGYIVTLRQNGFVDGFMSFNYCSFLSYFGYNQNEIICGGYQKLMILNIRSIAIKNKINYSRFIKPISFLHHFLNETALFYIEPRESDYKILNIMINEKQRCPNYINLLFKSFCDSFKNSIIINMRILKKYYNKLLNKFLITKECKNMINISFISCKLFKKCKIIKIEMETNNDTSMDIEVIKINDIFIKTLLSEIQSINNTQFIDENDDEKKEEENEIKIEEIKIYQIEIEKDKINEINKKLNEYKPKWKCDIIKNAKDKENKNYFGMSLSFKKI